MAAAAAVGAAAGTCWSLLLPLERCSTWEALPARGLARNETLSAAESPSGSLLPAAARLPSSHHHPESCAVPLAPCCPSLPELPESTCQQFRRCCHWAPRCTRPSPSDAGCVAPARTHTPTDRPRAAQQVVNSKQGARTAPKRATSSCTGRPSPSKEKLRAAASSRLAARPAAGARPCFLWPHLLASTVLCAAQRGVVLFLELFRVPALPKTNSRPETRHEGTSFNAPMVRARCLEKNETLNVRFERREGAIGVHDIHHSLINTNGAAQATMQPPVNTDLSSLITALLTQSCRCSPLAFQWASRQLL